MMDDIEKIDLYVNHTDIPIKLATKIRRMLDLANEKGKIKWRESSLV